MKIWKTKQKIRRWFSSKEIASDTVVILSNPRSGSTWLLDALRCHPQINLQVSAGFYNRFSLDGKRYPGDMSMQAKDGQEIEVLPTVMQTIPNFKITPNEANVELKTAYAIEKIHPEFYDFNTKNFLHDLTTATQENFHFKFILLMRNPLGAMQSFYHYQQRNPNWYAWMDTDKLVAYTLATFESMALFYQEFGGLVIDYADFLERPKDVLIKIYQHIWDESGYIHSSASLKDIEQAIALTQREKRKTSGTSFLGEKTGKVTIQKEDLPFYDEKYQADIEKMVQLFEQIKT